MSTGCFATGWTGTSDATGKPSPERFSSRSTWLPFLFYLLLLARLLERLGTTDWGRLFVFTTACFGTFVSGFLGSLNNHTVAAAGALFALYHCLRIHLDDDRRWWRFLLAGLFSGWTLCNELPAVALAAGLMLWLMRLSFRDTLRFALPAMLLPVAVYLFTQYVALGSVLPTYGHERWYRFAGSYWLNPAWRRPRRGTQAAVRVQPARRAYRHPVIDAGPRARLDWDGSDGQARRGSGY